MSRAVQDRQDLGHLHDQVRHSRQAAGPEDVPPGRHAQREDGGVPSRPQRTVLERGR